MATRDSWKVYLKCPACGIAGDADVSAGDHPITCPIETLRIDHIPDGFRERRLGDTMWTTKFECAQCGMMTHS
jgi:predicted RNA-binding Zn-ribbon protein involved in translation (DUF1610 family)